MKIGILVLAPASIIFPVSTPSMPAAQRDIPKADNPDSSPYEGLLKATGSQNASHTVPYGPHRKYPHALPR